MADDMEVSEYNEDVPDAGGSGDEEHGHNLADKSIAELVDEVVKIATVFGDKASCGDDESNADDYASRRVDAAHDRGASSSRRGNVETPAKGGWGNVEPPAKGGWGNVEPQAKDGWGNVEPQARDGWGNVEPPAKDGWGNEESPAKDNWGNEEPPAKDNWGQANDDSKPTDGNNWGSAENIGPPPDAGGWEDGNNTGPVHENGNPHNATDTAIAANLPAIPVIYFCGKCRAETEYEKIESTIDCKECGYHLFYKKRHGRFVQLEAR